MPKVPIKEIEKWADANIPLSELAKEDRAYMTKLTDDMSKYGQLRPIDVKTRKDGTKFIKDGHHRLVVAKKLGWKDMNVNFVRNPMGERNPDLFPDRPLKDYSLEHLKKIYEWAAREKKDAVNLNTDDAQKRYWRLYDIQVAAHEEMKKRMSNNPSPNESSNTSTIIFSTLALVAIVAMKKFGLIT